MTGPGWLDGVFAALMMLVAICCAARLAIGRIRGRATELDADVLHVLMGVAMAGMFEPRLNPLPAFAWRVVFAAAAAWFVWQAIRARARTPSRASRCAHPVPHAVECAAMVYMLLAVSHAPGMTMPAMAGPERSAGGNPALALILALFMLGYVLWTTDRLASLSRIAAVRRRSADQGRQPVAAASPVTARQRLRVSSTTVDGGQAGWPSLAPRIAASYKIAMSIAMGYMLVTML
jgi:hypothetical protein